MVSEAVHDISLKFTGEDDGLRRIGVTAELFWFHAVVVSAIIVSVWITWPMWGPRDYPIVFPLATLPQVNLGPILIAACLLALMAPRLGAMSVTVLFAYGMAADQTRMQPEFFSLPLLLWGSLPSARARLTGRVSLVSLWFLAGFHKLLSSDFLHDAGPRLVMALPLPLMPEFVQYLHSGRRAKHCGTVSTTVGFSGSRATAVLSGWFAANRAPVNQVRGVDPGAIRKAEENP